MPEAAPPTAVAAGRRYRSRGVAAPMGVAGDTNCRGGNALFRRPLLVCVRAVSVVVAVRVRVRVVSTIEFAVRMSVSVSVVMSAVSVVVSAWAMAVSVSAQHEEADNVRKKAKRADAKHEARLPDFRRVDEARDGLEYDGDAQRDEKHGVERRAQDLGSNPLLRVSTWPRGRLCRAQSRGGQLTP